LPLALAHTQQGLAFEVIAGTAVGPPGERVVAVLPHFDPCLARLAQLLADIVQERGRDAQRHGTRRGRDRLVDREPRLLAAVDVPPDLPGGLPQRLGLLGGAARGFGAATWG